MTERAAYDALVAALKAWDAYGGFDTWEDTSRKASAMAEAIRSTLASTGPHPDLEKRRRDMETCGSCMGAGYSNHPDSGEICAICNGSGGVAAAQPPAAPVDMDPASTFTDKEWHDALMGDPRPRSSAAPVETDASIIAERLRTLATCEDELSHDCAAQWLREAASFIQRSSAATDDDPTANPAWDDGCDFAMTQLCIFLGVNQNDVRWDAATETVDGDVQAVIGNILRAKFGEDWGPVETAKHSPNKCGRECQYYDYFEMLWNWFADESRRGTEDMRANAANGGLSAYDFKGMLDEHEANLIPVPPQVVQVTDAMCEAAVKADQAERIQGFTYEAHHVIRDVWKDFSEQKVWEIDKNDADAEPKFRHQCQIERMRKVLEAALAVTRPEEK